MFKMVIDAGHGFNTAGKRTPDDEREWSFNNKVVTSFISAMSQYEGIEIKRVDDPTGKRDVPLEERTNAANAFKADIYISVHHNANNGTWGQWTGTETFTYLGSQLKSEKLANSIHPLVVNAVGLKNRGLKKADFHVLRETKMPAILIEVGYMDSVIDIKKLRDDSILKNVGVAIATGVAKYAGLKKKAVSAPKKETTEKVPTKSPSKTAPKNAQTANYKVVAGDTLWEISNKFNMTVDEIKSLNKLKSDTIAVGKILKVKKK